MSHSCLRLHLLQRQKTPVVFSNRISDWPAFSWSPANLTTIFGSEFVVRVRLGPSRTDEDILWEHKCIYEEVTIQEFSEWLKGGMSEQNRLQKYPPENFFGYFDYKHLGELFAENEEILKSVDWSPFGFDGRCGDKSTLWIGNQSAHTPCHQDAYGCNLVAQIHGRKRWILFPPSDSTCLYPTRVPYEESSVFSSVNLRSPCVNMWPKLKSSHPHVVTLQPGQVLFVPPKWWHFVECLDTAVSINTWIEMDSDGDSRLEEAVTRLLVTSLMSQSQRPLDMWLNPTEELTDLSTNVAYVKTAREEAEKCNVGNKPSSSWCSCQEHKTKSCSGRIKRSSCLLSPSLGALDPGSTPCPHQRQSMAVSGANGKGSGDRTDDLLICSCICSHEPLCSIQDCVVVSPVTVKELLHLCRSDYDDDCHVDADSCDDSELGLKRSGSDCSIYSHKKCKLCPYKGVEPLAGTVTENKCDVADDEQKYAKRLPQRSIVPSSSDPPYHRDHVHKDTCPELRATSTRDQFSVESVVNALCDDRVVKLVCDILKEKG